jgi:hypothetical protein
VVTVASISITEMVVGMECVIVSVSGSAVCVTRCVTGSAVWTTVSMTVTTPSPSSSSPLPPLPPPGWPSLPSSSSSPGSSGTTEYLGGSLLVAASRIFSPACGSDVTSVRHAENARRSDTGPRILRLFK